MNRRKHFFSLAFLLACFSWMPLGAQTVNEAEALAAATKFLNSKKSSNVRVRSSRSVQLSLAGTENIDNGEPAYYVFNNAESGFVVVSGQKQPVVMGYSESGSFDAENVPDGLKGLLAGYAEEMNFVNQNAELLDVNQTELDVSKPAIAPLCEAKWNQNDPYNLFTPTVDG